MKRKKVLCILTAMAAVLAFGSCGKSDLSSKDRSDYFKKVTKKLDTGGDLFAIVDVSGDAEKLASAVESAIDYMNKIEELPTEITELNLVGLADDLGLSSIAAFGMSSHRNGEIYRNKIYVHIPEGRKGLPLITGGEPGPFAARDLAPAGTDLVLEVQVDLKSMFELAGNLVESVGGAAVSEEFRNSSEEPNPDLLGMSASKIFGLLNTKVVLIGDIDSENPLQVPGFPIQFPSFDFLVCIDGVGEVFTTLVETIPEEMQTQMIEEGEGFQRMAMPVDDEVGQLMKPVVHHELETGRVLFASTKEYLEGCLSAATTVWDDESFEQAMEGLPEEGNSLSYVSAELMSEVLRLGKELMSQSVGMEQFPEGFDELVAELLPVVGVSTKHSEGTVLVNEEDGILVVQNSAASGKHALVFSSWSVLSAIVGPALTLQNVQADLSASEAARSELEIERLRLEVELLKAKLNESAPQSPETPE